MLGLEEDVNGQALEEAVPVAVRAELKELVAAVREAGELREGELQLNGGDPKRSISTPIAFSAPQGSIPY